MNILEGIKAHPLLTAGGVIVLLLLMRGGSSNAGNTGSLSLQSQSIASDTNVKLAGVNAGVAQANMAMQSHVADSALVAATAAHQTDTAGLVAAFTALLNNGQNMAAINAQHEDTQAQIASNQTVALDNTSKALASLKAMFQGRADLATIAANANQQQLQTQLQANQTLLETMRSDLPLIFQHQETMQASDNATKVTTANINAQATTAIAKAQANATNLAAGSNVLDKFLGTGSASGSGWADSLLSIGQDFAAFLAA